MSQCVASGCTYRSIGENRSDICLHVFPKNKKLRNLWKKACGRVHFPTNPRLCSQHFTHDAFKLLKLDEDSNYVRVVRKLKPEAVPTIFSGRKSLRPLMCRESNLRKHVPVWPIPVTILLIKNPGTDPVRLSVGVQSCPSKTDAATQTERVQTERVHRVNAAVQCPEDMNFDVFRDHAYAKRILVDLNLLSKCSLPTTLETFHSEYLKYLQEDTCLI